MNQKTVYFAQRNPALKERFRPRWRRHAALAMSMPPTWSMLRRYSHCDPVDDPPAGLGVTGRYDGVGIAWMASEEAYKNAQATDSMARMRADEMETFGRLVREFAFLCSETELKDDRQGQFKIFSVLNRGPQAPADLAAALIGGHAAEVLAHPELGPKLARLAVCVAGELAVAMGAGRKHHALIEYSFHSLEDAAAFFSSEAYAALARKHAGIVTEIERLATRELLLDDIELYD